MTMLKCASFFAGVGGIDFGFNQAGFETVYANEFDTDACKTYSLNHKNLIDCRDIRDVKTEELPDFDVMLAGFPCQPFSIAGYREGFEDKKDRGNLFFELVRIAKDKKPTVIFLENVKNLVTHDNGNTMKVIVQELEKMGYKVFHRVLNTSKYGNVPQNRERIYIVAFLTENENLPFSFPSEIPLTKTIHDIVCDEKIDDRYYYTEKFSYFDELKNSMTNKNTVYQWRRKYVRENKHNLCPTLTANMGTGGNNVPLVLTQHGIRKLTPKECFLFQGFPNGFILPKDSTDYKLWKQAGNSVSVPVIRKIAENILEVIEQCYLNA